MTARFLDQLRRPALPRAVSQALLLVLLLVATAANAVAADRQYTVAAVPNVRLSDTSQYVSDPSAILSPAARDTINAVLARLERQTGIETAVVMLPSIGDADVFDFAQDLFRKWGIGKKKSDNGLLFLFVMDQHKVRIHVGYGLEGDMTDAMSKRIQTTLMVPRFKQADWDGGMVAGVRAAARVLDGSMKPDPADDDIDGEVLAIFILGLIIVVVLLAIFLAGVQQRCPKCRRRGALKLVSRQTLRTPGGRRIRRSIYVCKYCGHVVQRDDNITDDGLDAATNGAILGSMLGGGRGGGGFSGGSFGGGSTGGGGATSGW